MPSSQNHLIKDLLNPENKMFFSDGQKPELCIIGIHPDFDERVEAAVRGINDLMKNYMLEENMALVTERELQLLSGQVVELHEGAILVSCAYEDESHKIMYIDLHAPQSLALH